MLTDASRRRRNDCNKAAREVQRVLAASPRKNQQDLVLTPIATVAPTNIQENVLVFIPGTSAVAVPIAPAYRTLQVSVTLSSADKLAVGKTLQLKTFLATVNGHSGAFFNGTDWTSYGPNGWTVTLPDGTVLVNPDPTLQVPLAPFAGKFIYLTYITQGITNAGAVISGAS